MTSISLKKLLKITKKNSKNRNVKQTQKKSKQVGGKIKNSVALALSLGALTSSFLFVSGELSNHKKNMQKRLNKLKGIDDETKNNVIKLIANTSDKDLKELEKYAKKKQKKRFNKKLAITAKAAGITLVITTIAGVGVTLGARVLAVMYNICKNDTSHESDISYTNNTISHVNTMN